MAATIEETAGKVVGRDPKPDAFETTLAGKPDSFYAGGRLLFLTGELVRFSARVADYRRERGFMVIDGSFPRIPEAGDDFVVQRSSLDDTGFGRGPFGASWPEPLRRRPAPPPGSRE